MNYRQGAYRVLYTKHTKISSHIGCYVFQGSSNIETILL